MRLITAVLLVLLIAGPALAEGDPLDSEHQTQGYGRIFGYVCAAASVLVVLLVSVHVIRGMVAESARGKKSGVMPEAVLDNAPPMKKQALYLGEKVPDWKVANRQAATDVALKFLSRKDDWFEATYLAGVVEKAFRSVKEGLEERTAKKLERLVTADCLEELRMEMQRLRREGERHRFGRLDVTDVHVVQVEAAASKTKHTFTALISVRSRDFIEDDKTGDVLKGDKKTYAYQEFWRFRRSKERWLVERIRSSGDMDRVLTPKNVLTQADLTQFAKKADPDYLREFVAG